MPVVLSSIRRHPWRTLSVSLLVLVGAGTFLGRDLIRLALTPDRPIDYTLPLTEPLQPGPGEVVYRIDAARSELTVEVDEILAGVANRVEMTTQGIAGDIAVADGSPPSVRLGEIAVDVHQLRSDNSLRDKALRHEYLESHVHRQVRLSDARVLLPAGTAADRVEGAGIEGTLEVKDLERPVRWIVSASVTGDTLTATATTTVSMSDFGVGPISKVGLVRTSDEVDLTLRLVAVDGRGFAPPVGLVSEEVETRAIGAGPSFVSEVQPVLEQNCAGCHQSGAVGASMWTLDTARQAAEVADGLSVVTGAGYMPPWPASDLSIPFQHTRGLTDDEIRSIAEWAAAGGPLDVDPDTPVEAPEAAEVELPRPDRIVRLREPYRGGPDLRDDYRCFILDPELTEPTFLTGYTFDPDRPEIVHHAIVNRLRAAQRASVEDRDAGEPGSGWSCMTGMASNEGQRIGGWVPGQRPLILAEGDGFEFDPGDVLVAQIHYHYEESAPPDRSGMTLQFADDPEGITALQSRTLIGPVELPCPEGVDGPLCDRDAAIADVGQRFGPGGARIANALNMVCGTSPADLAATSDGITATTTCDYPVNGPGELVGVLGHMHELGSKYRMTLNPDTPEETVLLDIPLWNFGWQLNYQPVTDVALSRGDTIRVSCSWDRRLRFDPVPRYIVFAEGTEDEMCFSTLTIRPTGPSEGRRG
jgi:mono/diheme cytochrome c family protein/polyisoprenoid-binding protein YceI